MKTKICILNWYILGRQFEYIYILSVYSPFSDRVGLPLHNTPFPGVLMKIIGAAFFLPDALPDVNHIHGMQYVLCILTSM